MTTLNHFIKDTARYLIIHYPSYWKPDNYQHNKDMVDKLYDNIPKKTRNIIAGRITKSLNSEFYYGKHTTKWRGGTRKKRKRKYVYE